MFVIGIALKQAFDFVNRNAQFRQITRLDEDAEFLHQPVEIGAATGRNIIYFLCCSMYRSVLAA